jgi:hypothetical protein
MTAHAKFFGAGVCQNVSTRDADGDRKNDKRDQSTKDQFPVLANFLEKLTHAK